MSPKSSASKCPCSVGYMSNPRQKRNDGTDGLPQVASGGPSHGCRWWTTSSPISGKSHPPIVAGGTQMFFCYSYIHWSDTVWDGVPVSYHIVIVVTCYGKCQSPTPEI